MKLLMRPPPWLLLIPILHLTMGLSLAAGDMVECPQNCMCLLNTVRCVFQKSSEVPQMPANTTVLDLSFNNIEEVGADTFRGLGELIKLLLNDNRIRQLSAGTFDGAPKLRILHLQKNRIDRIAPGAFAGLPELEQLFLHDNMLHRLPADAFLDVVGPKTRLRLNGNALVCDCDLVWLVERSRNSRSEMSAVCWSPSEMEGRSLTTMSPEDFHCIKPHITEGPEDVEVRVGGMITFVCRATGDPTPRIKWTKDSNEVDEDGEKYVIREDGTLLITDVTERDMGEYECTASSDMGTTKSRKARAIAPVKFTEIPQSRAVAAGTDVSFVCKAAGSPTPTVQWRRNGELIVHGERFSLEEDGHVLRVRAAKQSDAATYVCRAENDHGYAETSAELSVIPADASAPRITYEPHDMEAELGTVIEVPCRAEGNPRPAIQWKKDGSALEDERIKISRGGSLYIYNVTSQDDGRYECSAVNDYGHVTGHAMVRVRQPGATDTLIIRAFRDATMEIDRSINNTLESLFNATSTRDINMFRLARFPNAIARAAARPAEIFERTLVNIRRMVNAGATANVTDEFRYDEILSPEQVQQIETMSGCTGHRHRQSCSNMCFHHKYRTIDGSCNNLRHPTWGSSYTGFRRILQPIYENGFSMPVGWEKGRRYYGHPKPAARLVSNTLMSTHDITSDDQITHMVMQWGQFLDHDFDHSLPAVSSESWDGIDCKKSCDNAAPCFPMDVPPNDPRISNRRCIDFVRTSAVCGSGATSVLWGKLTPREQLNQLTSYLDASQVYGYDDKLARELRDLITDEGLLREGPTIPGHKPLPPYEFGQFLICHRDLMERPDVKCFVTGDPRANEQVALLAMHTIWLREHNRIARALRDMNPHWDGEKLYQEARRIVAAEMQHITYQHWLPRIFGAGIDELLPPYRGYNPNVDATISNVFATAALRFGHSLIQPRLERLNASFQPTPEGALNLRDAFFTPWRLLEEGGVDPLIRGMFAVPAKLKLPEQNVNTELTEQLFRTAHAVALDLAAMNIQRGRDHALPGYLEWRYYCNMSRVDTFDDLAGEISSDQVRQKLRELYGHPGNMDVWVGGILEDQLPGAKVGPLFRCLLLEQFRRTRDGDRFWYESAGAFRAEQLAQIQQVTLARILCDNGDNITRLQPDVFLLAADRDGYVSCDEIPYMDLSVWTDCCDNCEEHDYVIYRSRRAAAEKYSASANDVRARDNATDSSISRIDDKVEQEMRRMVEKAAQKAKKLQEQAEDLLRKVDERRVLLENMMENVAVKD